MAMRSLWLGGLLAIAGSLAFGQLESDTLAVTASRQIFAQPDQVVFRIDVNSSVSTGLDQVVAALQSAGVTKATFRSLSSASPQWFNGPVLDWSFTLAAPLAKIKATTALLAAAEQRISDQKTGGLSMSFSLQGAQVSPELESQQCSIPDLRSDAQTQAQKLASAAGFGVGPVLVLSSGIPGSIIPTAAFRASLGSKLLGIPSGSIISPAVSNCSMTVKFKLVRFHRR